MGPLHKLAKTAQFVQCHCPNCAIDQYIHGSNSMFDVQHHVKAAGSQDPAVREAYWHAYPVGYDHDLGRISDLGQIGKRTPHRGVWSTDSAKKYISHVAKINQDEGHKLYTGLDVTMPDVPRLDMDMLSEQSGKQIIKPYWME